MAHHGGFLMMQNWFRFISLDPSRALREAREEHEAWLADMRFRRQERAMDFPTWSVTTSSSSPVPMTDWMAKDDTLPEGEEQWLPVVAVNVQQEGELLVCVAPRGEKPRWLTNPEMRRGEWRLEHVRYRPPKG